MSWKDVPICNSPCSRNKTNRNNQRYHHNRPFSPLNENNNSSENLLQDSTGIIKSNVTVDLGDKCDINEITDLNVELKKTESFLSAL